MLRLRQDRSDCSLCFVVQSFAAPQLARLLRSLLTSAASHRALLSDALFRLLNVAVVSIALDA
jgi:hypothetical protein